MTGGKKFTTAALAEGVRCHQNPGYRFLGVHGGIFAPEDQKRQSEQRSDEIVKNGLPGEPGFAGTALRL